MTNEELFAKNHYIFDGAMMELLAEIRPIIEKQEREKIFKRIDEMQEAGYFDQHTILELDKLRQALKEEK